MIQPAAAVRLYARTTLMAVCALLAVSCSDNDTTGPVVPEQPPIAGAALLTCTVTTEGVARMECRPSVGQVFAMPGKSLVPAGAKASLLSAVGGTIILGGQGTNVQLTSTNIVATASQVTGDVTVQNLIGQALGTADGTTLAPEGVRVFFSSGPNANVGTVTVGNANGTAFFTASDQPYHQYNEILSPNEVSPSKQWVFNLAGGATTFTFGVYVWAPVQYPDGWIDVTPSSDALNLNTGDVTQQLTGTVRNALGASVVETITWGTLDAEVATVDAAGLVTAHEAGSTAITATAGAKTGSASISVTGPSLTNSTVTSQFNEIAANGTSTSVITVQLKNAANANVTIGGRTVVIATDKGSISGTTDNGNGTYTATLTSSTTIETATVTATVDDDALTDNASVAFVAGALDHFEIVAAGGGAIGTQTKNAAFNIQITAMDANNHVVTTYVGKVDLTTQGGVSVTIGLSDAFVAGVLSSQSVAINGSGAGVAIQAVDNGGGVAAGTSNTFTVNPSDIAPSVTSTTPLDAATSVNAANAINIVFSENVTVTAASFDLECPAATDKAFTLSGSNASYTLTPTGGLPGVTTCTVTVIAANVSDTDTDDVPDNMAANYVFSFTTAPVALPDTYDETVLGNVSVNSANGTAFNVLANDQKDGGTQVTSAGWLATPNKSENGGDVIITAAGTFTYNPPAGFEGTDRFTYTVTGGSTANVTLTVANMLWFVDRAAAPCALVSNGCGRMSNPFNSLADFNTANNGTGNNPAAGDGVFLYENASSYTGPVTLLATQDFIGQDATAQLSALGYTAPARSPALPVTDGANATKVTIAGADGVNLGSNNLLRGFTLATTAGEGLSGTTFGTLTLAGDVAFNTTGSAMSLNTGAISGNPASVTSSGGANNILLTAVTGTSNFGAGALSGSTTAGLAISGGTISLTYGGSITGGTGATINVSNAHATGTLTLTGQIAASTGTGLQFNNADGIYNLGGVAASSTLAGGDAGVDITNGSEGTFTFGANLSISNPTGTAFNVNGSTPAVTWNGNITKTNGGLAIDITGQAASARTITFQNGTIAANTNSTGIQLSDVDGTVSFNGTNTLSGGDAGIDVIGGSAGTIAFGASTTITNPSGAAVFVDASAPTLTIAGSISTNAGRPVHIEDLTGGSIAISASINATGQGILVQNNTSGSPTIDFTGTRTLNTAANTAVLLDNNDNATITFGTAAMNITTAAGAGFRAINGGTVNVTGTLNNVTTTTGTAVAIENTTIGVSGAHFRSVSANGAPNGISLLNTGTAGSLSIEGDGSATSGGTIQNTTGSGISLNNTTGPNFTRMVIQNTSSHGIFGMLVNNFTLTNSTISGSGTTEIAGRQESNISFYQNAGTGAEKNVTGNVTITGNTLNTALHHGINITQYDGTITSLNVSNNTFTSATASSGSANGATTSHGTAVNVNLIGGAAIVSSLTSGVVSNNVITGFPGNAGILFGLGNANPAGPTGSYGAAGDSITIQSNRIRGHSSANLMNTQAINVAINGRSTGFFRIVDNGTLAEPITNMAGHAITVSSFAATTLNVRVSNNRIVANNTVGSNGISMGADSSAGFGPVTTTVMNAIVNNNIVSNTHGSAMLVAVLRNATIRMRIQSNVLGANLGGATYAMQLRNSSSTTSTGTTCFHITGNTATGTGAGPVFPGIGLRRQSGAVTNGPNIFGLVGLSPSPAGTPTVENFVNASNTSTSGTFGTGGTALASASTGFTSCTLPF